MPAADINAQFQQALGRPATPEESAYLQKFISEGNLQPGEIGTLLQGHPEYQANLLNKNVAQYGQTLQANDSNILQQGADRAGAQAQSRFAGLGRQNSSGMAAQVFGQTGQIANGLAQSRQSALASFYGQGMQNNAAMAGQQGQQTLGRAYDQQNMKLQRQWQIDDYNRQQNDWNDAQNGQNRLFGGAVASRLANSGMTAGAAYMGSRYGMQMQGGNKQSGGGQQ